VLGAGDLSADFLADEVSVKVQAADFDRALGDENADDVTALRIEFQGNAGPPAA
jgi:hypothetical protein